MPSDFSTPTAQTKTPEPKARELGDRLTKPLPSCDTSDPAQVEAWFGPFGYAEYYRKVVLSTCKELVRAEMAVKGETVTEKRLDDLAHTHPNYLSFLLDSLEGRRIREMMARERIGA